MIKTTVKVDGMMCGMCEAHVADAIRNAFPDAKKVSASRAKKEATFLSEEKPDETIIKNVITATGYGIGENGEPFAGLEMYITSGNNSAPSVTYGSNLPTAGGVTWTKVAKSPIALTSQTAAKYATVALVNAQTGKAVAAGSATEVVGV